MILDSRAFNAHCLPPKFSYDTLKQFRHELAHDDFIIVIDLAQGYVHVAIHPDSRTKFGCAWRGQSFVYASLPFGWNASCFAFQRTMLAVGAFLARLGLPCMVYLDDVAARCYRATPSRSKEQRGLDSAFVLLEVLYGCGFRLNRAKCQLTPSTEVRCLGFLINTSAMSFKMLPDRIGKLVEFARVLRSSPFHVSRSSLLSFTGKAVSLLIACPPIRIYIGPIWDLLSSSTAQFLDLTETVCSALLEFSDVNVKRWGTLARWVPDLHEHLRLQSLEIYSDAAGGTDPSSGWGGVIYYPGAEIGTPARGSFVGADTTAPIHIKEAIAALTMLRLSGVHDSHVILHTDNRNVHGALSKSYTSAVEFRPVIRACVEYQLDANVILSVRWLSSRDNSGADFESRSVGKDASMVHVRPAHRPTSSLSTVTHPGPVDRSDHMLHPTLVIRAQAWAGVRCTIDTCATSASKQFPRFIGLHQSSDPDQVGVDCLAAGLAGEIFWCNPPFSILPPLISHLESIRATGLLVFPALPGAPWFRSLVHKASRITKIAEAGNRFIFWQQGLAPGDPLRCIGVCPLDIYVALLNFSTH